MKTEERLFEYGVILYPNDFYSCNKRSRKVLNKIDIKWFKEDKYPQISLDEKLTLILGNIMYCHKYDSLSFDDDHIHDTLVKCNNKSWIQACRIIHEYHGVKPHNIDKKSMLLKSLKTFLDELLNVTDPKIKDICSSRNEIGCVLRLYHLLGYDKSLVYSLLHEYQKISHLPQVFEYIEYHLRKSSKWTVNYIKELIEYADNMAFSINHEVPFLKRLGKL